MYLSKRLTCNLGIANCSWHGATWLWICMVIWNPFWLGGPWQRFHFQEGKNRTWLTTRAFEWYIRICAWFFRESVSSEVPWENFVSRVEFKEMNIFGWWLSKKRKEGKGIMTKHAFKTGFLVKGLRKDEEYGLVLLVFSSDFDELKWPTVYPMDETLFSQTFVRKMFSFWSNQAEWDDLLWM